MINMLGRLSDRWLTLVVPATAVDANTGVSCGPRRLECRNWKCSHYLRYGGYYRQCHGPNGSFRQYENGGYVVCVCG